MRGSVFSRYEQFETYPETIEQELQLPFANSDRVKENYRIDITTSSAMNEVR